MMDIGKPIRPETEGTAMKELCVGGNRAEQTEVEQNKLKETQKNKGKNVML
jgi:hypothetical protein